MIEAQSIYQRIMNARCITDDGRTFSGDAHLPELARRHRLSPISYAVPGAALLGVLAFCLYQFPAIEDAIAQVSGKQSRSTFEPPPRPKFDETAGPSSVVGLRGTTALPVNPFDAHAAAQGVKACAATYSALGKALTDGSQFMVVTQTARSDADQHSVQGVVGMAYVSGRGYTGPAAGLIFAGPTARGCEGNGVRVVPSPQNCQAFAAALPQGSQPFQQLSGIPVYVLSTGEQTMLVPAGSGCIVVSIVRAGG